MKNICNRTVAARGERYGYADAYDSSGEVVEIAGVAGGGVESGAVVRGSANLVTRRGNVFRGCSIGQVVRQTRDGSLVVTAESRRRTPLERFAEASARGLIRFRRLGYEPLTP